MIKKITALAIAIAMTMLVASMVQAASPGEPQGDLLAAVTSTADVIGAAQPMSESDLATVRGEGTFTQFYALPQLNRSFNKTFSQNGTTVTLVGEAGFGVTITVDSPLIP